MAFIAGSPASVYFEMAIFKLPPFLRKRRSHPRPAIAQTSPLLEKLSVDLILCILDFLPPESVILFSLTCKPLYNITGTSLLEALKTDDRARYNFLAVLEHEWPGHLACYRCARLHAIKETIRYHPTSYAYLRIVLKDRLAGRHSEYPWSPCGTKGDYRQTRLALHSHFSSDIFRMTMKAYRQNQSCLTLLQLLSHKPKILSSGIEAYTGSARIGRNEMLWRDQRVYIYTRALTVNNLFPWRTSVVMSSYHFSINAIVHTIQNPALRGL